MEARDAEANIARQVLKLRQTEAEDLIWQFAKYKALAVGLNPVAFLDVMGATVADLALIRSLSRLYGLPMTGYEAGKLWQTIFSSAAAYFWENWVAVFCWDLAKVRRLRPRTSAFLLLPELLSLKLV